MKEFTTLAEFAAWARERAHVVERASAEYRRITECPEELDRFCDAMDVKQWEQTYLHPDPNEEDCRFCRAMPTCPAAARKLQAAVGAAFSVIVETPDQVPVPPLFAGGHGDDDVELSVKMKAVPFIEDWCIAVRAEVERRLLADVPVPGFGLGYGREGPRYWTDKSAAEAALRALGIKDELIYSPRELKSPTQIEDIAPKRNAKGEVVKSRTRFPILTVEQWDSMQELIKRNPPKPSVQPIGGITKPYVRPVVDGGAFTAEPE